MAHGTVRIGGIQIAGLEREKSRNIQHAEDHIRRVADMGAQIVLSPEVVTTGFVGGDDERAMAEPIPGPTTERFAKLAQELDVHALIGLSELRDDRLHNAIAVLNRTGDLMGVMRKVHINRYETAGGWTNGSEFPVWEFHTDTGAMTGGVMICYDREVPESARLLMLSGADVIFNPLCCNCPTDEIHRCLLRTRAFENEVYVFMVNHAAPRCNGHSFAIDFNGYIRAELDKREGVFVFEADLDALVAHRENGIYGKHHRRPELYAPLSDPAGQIHPADANVPNRPSRVG